MGELLAVGCGGFLGSCARYLVSLGMKYICPNLPAGTLLANVLASFVIGFATSATFGQTLSAHMRLFLTVGICGGLSTFSTFSNETVQLMQTGHIFVALLNVTCNVVLSCIAVFLGLYLSRCIFAR